MSSSSFHRTSKTLGDNMGLVSAVIAVLVAQLLKPFSEWAVTRRFKPSLAVGSGAGAYIRSLFSST